MLTINVATLMTSLGVKINLLFSRFEDHRLLTVRWNAIESSEKVGQRYPEQYVG